MWSATAPSCRLVGSETENTQGFLAGSPLKGESAIWGVLVSEAT